MDTAKGNHNVISMEPAKGNHNVISYVTRIRTWDDDSRPPCPGTRVLSKKAVLRALSEMGPGVPLTVEQPGPMGANVMNIIGTTTSKPYAVREVEGGVEYTVDGIVFFGNTVFTDDRENTGIVSISFTR